MKTVVTACGPVDPTRRALCTAVQKHVLDTAHDFDALPTITPADLAVALEDATLRDQLSRALCLQVIVPDTPARAELDLANQFVKALGGPVDALDRMRSGYEHRMITLRFDAVRTSFMGDSARRRLADEGAIGLLANIGEILGVYENNTIAARYRSLGALPLGSLGRILFSFYKERGFAFPGEKGGAPESIIAHGLTHVGRRSGVIAEIAVKESPAVGG